MTRDPLLRSILLVPLLLARFGCGRDPQPYVPPPGPATLPAVAAHPPLRVLRAAPETLVIGGDTVRLKAQLEQDFSGGDEWGMEESASAPVHPVVATLYVLPDSAALAVVEAWVMLDDRPHRVDVERFAVGPSTGHVRWLARVEQADVIVRLLDASGRIRFLQQRAVPVWKVE